MSYSLSVKGGQFDLDDPDGKTESPIFIVPQLFVNYKLNRSLRILSGVEYWKGEFQGGRQELKQDMDGYGIFAGLEKGIKLTYSADVWLGATLGYKEWTFEHRQMVDGDGFLVESFLDRKSSIGTVKIHSMLNFDLGKKWSAGVGLFSELSEMSTFTGLELTIRI